MTQGGINDALRAYVSKFAVDNQLKVAWSNISFTDTESIYLAVHIIPASKENIGLALDMPVFRGILQINVVGKAGSGESQIMSIADRLSGHLENGTQITDTLYLSDESDVLPAISNSSNYTIPVSAPYRCNSTR